MQACYILHEQNKRPNKIVFSQKIALIALKIILSHNLFLTFEISIFFFSGKIYTIKKLNYGRHAAKKWHIKMQKESCIPHSLLHFLPRQTGFFGFKGKEMKFDVENCY
jgi:N-glycosylase/DNA lyase